MGSEFSYEDLGSREIEKYTYKYMGEENLNNMQCFVIELSPNDKKIQATAVLSHGWTEKNTGHGRKSIMTRKTDCSKH